MGWGPPKTLTPRELLERLLEWGEPLRSRDTCFRTSEATVLRAQNGTFGIGNFRLQLGLNLATLLPQPPRG